MGKPVGTIYERNEFPSPEAKIAFKSRVKITFIYILIIYLSIIYKNLKILSDIVDNKYN